MQLNYILQNGSSSDSSSSPSSSSDLEQGGLEIPAKIIFQNSNERIIEEIKKKLTPLSEEYNKNINCYYIIFIRFYVHAISFFLKKLLNSNFFSPELGVHLN